MTDEIERLQLRVDDLWTTLNLEREERDELRRENFELRTMLYRHRRAINSINSIVSDMMDKIRERGPSDDVLPTE